MKRYWYDNKAKLISGGPATPAQVGRIPQPPSPLCALNGTRGNVITFNPGLGINKNYDAGQGINNV